MKPWIILVAATVCACATTGTDAPTAYQQARDEGSVNGINEDGERVRCERIRQTGSRFTERVCRTEREWERIEDAARLAAEDSQDRWPRDCGPEPGGAPRC